MIDDDEMMRIFFRDIFWIHGGSAQKYDVTILDSLTKAREFLGDKNNYPDIIFLDLSMPVKDANGATSMETEPSVEFIKGIRRDPALSHTPIIVFSGFTENALKEKVKEAGADHYLVKGEYMPKELIDFVEKL